MTLKGNAAFLASTATGEQVHRLNAPLRDLTQIGRAHV